MDFWQLKLGTFKDSANGSSISGNSSSHIHCWTGYTPSLSTIITKYLSMSPKVSMHKYRSVGVTLLISTSVPRETYHNYFQVEFFLCCQLIANMTRVQIWWSGTTRAFLKLLISKLVSTLRPQVRTKLAYWPVHWPRCFRCSVRKRVARHCVWSSLDERCKRSSRSWTVRKPGILVLLSSPCSCWFSLLFLDPTTRHRECYIRIMTFVSSWLHRWVARNFRFKTLYYLSFSFCGGYFGPNLPSP